MRSPAFRRLTPPATCLHPFGVPGAEASRGCPSTSPGLHGIGQISAWFNSASEKGSDPGRVEPGRNFLAPKGRKALGRGHKPPDLGAPFRPAPTGRKRTASRHRHVNAFAAELYAAQKKTCAYRFAPQARGECRVELPPAFAAGLGEQQAANGAYNTLPGPEGTSGATPSFWLHYPRGLGDESVGAASLHAHCVERDAQPLTVRLPADRLMILAFLRGGSRFATDREEALIHTQGVADAVEIEWPI